MKLFVASASRIATAIPTAPAPPFALALARVSPAASMVRSPVASTSLTRSPTAWVVSEGVANACAPPLTVDLADIDRSGPVPAATTEIATGSITAVAYVLAASASIASDPASNRAASAPVAVPSAPR